MSDTHPAIRAWREKRDQWIGSPLSGDCDALAAAMEAEVKARREAEAALTLVLDYPRDPSIPVPVPEVAAMKQIARDALRRR